ANNAPLLVSDGRIVELEKDKMPVGKGEKNDSFTLRKIDPKTADMIYLYTDGFADQFGGPKGKKFKYKALTTLLSKNSSKNMSEQQDFLGIVFEEWKGKIEQVDDVCVIGVRL
ncbi:MAG: PP2C family protein-serine/threonine phosphatase, partial [Bacteroidia bacterium]